MSDIHPSAVIMPGAQLGEGCVVGPFSYVGPHVRMGAGNVLHAHAVVDGHTEMGAGNEVLSFACIGKRSQDLKYKQGDLAWVRIGSRNVFREYVTVHAATAKDGATSLGDANNLLSYAHVAHDCMLGSNIIISGGAMLAGHVHVGDHATVGGMTGCVQFTRIGRGAYVGAMTKLDKDVLPFCIVDGAPARLRAVNKIGMERRGATPDVIRAVREAMRVLVRSGLTLAEAVERLRGSAVPEVREMVDFAASSTAGLARPAAGGGADD